MALLLNNNYAVKAMSTSVTENAGEATILLVFRTGATVTDGALFTIFNATTSNRFVGARIAAGHLQAGVRTASQVPYDFGPATPNTTYVISITKPPSGSASIRVNGGAAVTQAFSPITLAYNRYGVGTYYNGTTNVSTTNGEIAYVRAYARTLTTQELDFFHAGVLGSIASTSIIDGHDLISDLNTDFGHATPLTWTDPETDPPTFTAYDPFIPTQTIVSVNGGAGITPGVAATAVVSGFTVDPNAGTFGGKALTNFSYNSSNNTCTFTLPVYADGETFPNPNTPGVLTITNGTNSATFSNVAINPIANHAIVNVGVPVSNDNTYLGAHITLVNGDRLIYPTESGNFTVLSDGGVQTTTAGSRVLYLWTATSGIITQVNLTANEQSLTTVVVPGNAVRAGQNNGWTVSGFTPTSVSYAGLSISTFDNDSIFIPTYSTGSSYPAFGTHEMVVTDGTTSVDLDVDLLPELNFAYVTLTNVSNTSEGYISHYLTCAVGDQILYQTASSLGVTANGVDPDGRIYTDAFGDIVLWHRRNSNGLMTEISVDVGVGDVVPDAFTIPATTDAALNASIVSNAVTITGISTGANSPISTTGLEYSISGDGGTSWSAYTSIAGNIQNNNQVRVRIQSSSSYSTAVSGTLTIGGVSATYSVTTIANTSDTVPDAFDFTNVSDVATNSYVESNVVIISGITAVTPITTTGGLQYSISVDGGTSWSTYTSVAGNIQNGNRIRVRLMSSSSTGTGVSGTIVIGGVSDTFTVTTLIPDLVPNAFTFEDNTNSNINSVIESNSIVIGGMTSGYNSAVSVVDLEYSISVDGGTSWSAYTSIAGNIQNGNQIKVRIQSSASYSTAVSGTLTIGGVSDTFTVTTVSADVVPDAYNFTDSTNANLTEYVASNVVTITGVAGGINIPVTVTNLEYRISTNGGTSWSTYTSIDGVIQNGNQIQVRVFTSGESNTPTTGTIVIGGISDTFTVTTMVIDLTPDVFTFTPLTNVAYNQLIEGSPITVSGMTPGFNATVTLTGSGLYSIYRTGAWTAYTATSGVIQNGEQVRVAVYSSPLSNTTTSAVLSIGGVLSTQSVTTAVADITPNPFTINPVVDVLPNTMIVSDPVTITGMTPYFDSPITVTNLEYSVSTDSGNSWSAYTSTTGTIANDNLLRVRRLSSVSYETTVSGTVSINGVSSAFLITTIEVDLIPDAFSFSAVDDIDLNATVISDPATITGLSVGYNSPVTVTGGMYSIYRAGSWTTYTASAGVIQNDELIRVMLTASSLPSTATSVTLSIGGVNATFTAYTVDADTTPDVFNFNQLSSVAVSTYCVSNIITVAGITPSLTTTITVTGMQYSVFTGGSWSAYTTSAGTVVNGDQVRVRLLSSADYNTATSGQLNIGGVTAGFTVNTLVADGTPNPIVIPAVTNAALNASIESQIVTVTGVSPGYDVNISVANCQYSVYRNNVWTAYTASAGAIQNGEQFRLVLTSSNLNATTVSGSVTIGGIVGTFAVTTISVVDIIPNDYIIQPVQYVDVNTSVESTPVGITGMTPGYDSPVTVSGLVYSIYRNGNWTAFSRSAGTIRNGEYIKTNIVSSLINGISKTGSITIGGVTRTYVVTTIPKTTVTHPRQHDKLS